MLSVSSISTKSAYVPFKLHNLEFPLLRNFLDIMPSADLFLLRKHDATIEKLSHFRGEIIERLYILTDTVEPWNHLYEMYSKVMSRPVKLTVSDFLQVHMGPDICPTALLSKMNEKTYRCLYIAGQYHWKQVISFLHTGINRRVCLYDNMDLPEEDMEEFFTTLCSYKINEFNFFNTNCNKTWVDTVHKTWSSLIGTVFKSVEGNSNSYPHFGVTAVTNNNKVMELVMKDSDRENNDNESDDNELTDDYDFNSLYF